MPATEPASLQAPISSKQIHLVRHTYQLIGRKGTHRVTLQDVADAAGVSKAVIVYYFQTKENLVLETMRWVLAQVEERIRQSITPEDSPEGRIRAMVDAIFIDAERNRNFYLAYLSLIDNAARLDRFNELSTTFRSIVDSLYGEVIESGRSGGAFQVQDVDEAAKIVRAIVDGLFVQWLQESDWVELHAVYKDLCTNAVLTYLGRGN